MSILEKLGLPDLSGIEQAKQMIGEYVKFSHDALITIIKNQHAIHARLAQIEQKCAIAPQPAMLSGPDALFKLNGEAPQQPEKSSDGP